MSIRVGGQASRWHRDEERRRMAKMHRGGGVAARSLARLVGRARDPASRSPSVLTRATVCIILPFHFAPLPLLLFEIGIFRWLASCSERTSRLALQQRSRAFSFANFSLHICAPYRENLLARTCNQTASKFPSLQFKQPNSRGNYPTGMRYGIELREGVKRPDTLPLPGTQ